METPPSLMVMVSGNALVCAAMGVLEDGDEPAVKIERVTGPRYHGTVGRAMRLAELEPRLAAMQSYWDERAGSMWCGEADAFGERMDAVEAEIRELRCLAN